MEGIFEGTGITELYMDHDPKDESKNKIGNFDEADIQESCTQEQGKYD